MAISIFDKCNTHLLSEMSVIEYINCQLSNDLHCQLI